VNFLIIYTIIKTTRLLVTQAVSVTGWPVMVGVVYSQPGADAEWHRCARIHCTQGLGGRGDGYQCGLDWGLSSKV